MGFGLWDGGARDRRVGWRPMLAVGDGSGFEVSLDARRREPANDGDVAHGMMFRRMIRW